MSAFEWVEIPENSVIILRGENLPELDENELNDSRFAEFHRLYPTCLIVVLSGEDSLEVRPESEIRELLEALIAHQEARER